MTQAKMYRTAVLKTDAREAVAITNEPHARFTKRIGNTRYRVGVYFSAISEETARDKILRLVKNDMALE